VEQGGLGVTVGAILGLPVDRPCRGSLGLHAEEAEQVHDREGGAAFADMPVDVFKREMLAVIPRLGCGNFDPRQQAFLRNQVDMSAVPFVEQRHHRVDRAEAAAEDDDGLIAVDTPDHAIGGVGRVEIAGLAVQGAEPVGIGRADRQ